MGQVRACAQAEAALAAARAKKESPAKIASLQEEFTQRQREIEFFNRTKEAKAAQKAARDHRAKKEAGTERLRSLRVLNTQNSLRQSWQQFVGNNIFVSLFAKCDVTDHIIVQNHSSLLVHSQSLVWTWLSENQNRKTYSRQMQKSFCGKGMCSVFFDNMFLFHSSGYFLISQAA